MQPAWVGKRSVSRPESPVASRKLVLRTRRWRWADEAACLARERETEILELRVSIEVQDRTLKSI